MHAPTPPDPNRSRAVIIAVNEHPLKEGADPKRRLAEYSILAEGAHKLAFLLQDPAVWGLPAANCVVLTGADRTDETTILDTIDEAVDGAEDSLLIYYTAHGGKSQSKYHLAHSGSRMKDIDRWTSWERLRGRIDRAKPSCQRMVVIDACYSATALNEPPLKGDSALLVSSGSDEFSWAAAGNTYATYTAALIEVLERGAGLQQAFLTASDLHRSIEAGLKKPGAESDPLRPTQTPRFQPSGLGHEKSWVKNKAFTGSDVVVPQVVRVPIQDASGFRWELPQADAAALQAYRLPSAAPGATRTGIDSRFQARLDLQFAVRRSAKFAVLADPVGHDLTAALNEVERRLPFDPAREWRAITAGDPPSNRSFPDGAGIVLEVGPDRGTDQVLQQIRQLRAHAPRSSVVCQVRRDLPQHAVEDAAYLARQCNLSEFLAYAQGLSVTTSRSRRLTTATGEAAAALVGALLDEGAADMPADVLGVDTFPSQTPAGPFAAQLVDELNASEPWGEAESRVIAAVRDLLPHLYPALLREHAATRHYPARYASLRTAARTDEETSLWIDSALGRLPWPGREVPMRLIRSRDADALVLGLIRVGRLDCAGGWARIASPDVVQVYWATAEGLAEQEFLPNASVETARAALRVGLGRGLDLRGIPHAFALPQCWALVAGRGVTPDLTAWLGQDHPLDKPVRDLICETGEPNLKEEAALARIRNALWPPLPST